MPSRTITYLGGACMLVFMVYLYFVVATISFANAQTNRAVSIRLIETSIGTLEENYYNQVSRVSTINPASLGLVTPSQVSYVSAERGAALTLAGVSVR